MPEILFEWVVLCGKQKYYLTEYQYEVLMGAENKRLVAFGNFTINPAYISSCYKRPAKEIKKLYPCVTCEHKGYLIPEKEPYIKTTCDNCDGTGVDLKAKPEVLMIENIVL